MGGFEGGGGGEALASAGWSVHEGDIVGGEAEANSLHLAGVERRSVAEWQL